jgi:potassium-transporting ATPase potassium-binding subunit
VGVVTNTNWQSYVPETTMSYLTQMAALTMHNSFRRSPSPSSGALPGASANDRQFLGRYDSHRYLYVLLPISIVVGLFFVWQGALPRRRRDFMPFDGRSL